ncbi:hypothetical protein Tco_1405863 [Tanacetum coccineum]
MSYRHQELTSPEQTATALASPKQTAIGKDYSNPLMAVSFLYALTKKPDVYISFIKQFWRSAEATTDDNGEVQITATIDGHSNTITEASLRRHLKLDNHDGITSIPNSEIFEQLALIGYHTDSDKLTFQKGDFSPQWRFLIHTILHCLSPKKTAIGSSLVATYATVVICLATNRTFNFSRLLRSLCSILGLKKLEGKVKAGTARKGARLSFLKDEEDACCEDDSSKQGRNYSDAKFKRKQDWKMNYYSRSDSTEVIQDQGHVRKGILKLIPTWSTKRTEGHKDYKDEKFLDSGMKRKVKEICLKQVKLRERDWNDLQFIRDVEYTKGYERSVFKQENLEQKERNLFQEKAQEVLFKSQKMEEMLSGEGRSQRIFRIENFMYNQVFRGDGSSKNYKILSEMLEDFDRQDVMDLHRLVKERYSASRPEGYDLMLWGDLHTLFEPDEEDEIWKNQHEYNVISWSLYDFCGIHILLMQNGIAIHMLTEKKYPLSQR